MPARIFQYLKIISLFILLGGFLFIVIHSVDPDLGWHLAVGKWIYQHHAVPHADIYSNTMPGFNWVDHEWLSDVGLWWLQAHNLWWLVVAIFTALVFFPFAIWIYRSKSLFDLWMILLAGMFMLRIIGVRTQMISFFLFFVFYEIISRRYHLDANSQKQFARDIFPKARVTLAFLLLPFLFLFWANIHAGFVLALGLLGLMGAGYTAWQWQKNARFPWGTAYDLGIVIFSCLATLVNPYGWRVYEFFYHALRSPETTKYINEWQSVLAFPLFSSCIFIALTLLFLMQLWREYPRHVFFVVSLLLLSFLRSVRNGPLFFVAAIPAIINGVQLLIQKISSVRASVNRQFTTPEVKKIQYVGIGLVVSGLFGFLYVLAQFQNIAYPVRAASVLHEYARQGNSVTLFNAYGWGGYLDWNVSEVQVFIDGRMDGWVDQNGNSAMREYVAVTDTTMPDAWKEIFQRRHVTAVLVPNTTPSPLESLGCMDRIRLAFRENPLVGGIYNILTNEPPARDFFQVLSQNGWHLLSQDPTAVLLECHAGPSCYGQNH